MSRRVHHPIALSTTISVGTGSPIEILDLAERAGVDGLVVGGAPARMEALLGTLQTRRGGVPLWAVELPSGDRRGTAPGLAAPGLAAIDRDEQAAAFERAEWVLRAGAALGASQLIVDLGEIRELQRDWVVVRDLFQRGSFDARSAQRFVEMRLVAGAPHLDMARRALDRLLRLAEDAGMSILLRNPRRVIGLPAARELDEVLRDFAGAPLGPLCDLPAAHLQELMGFAPLELALSTFGNGPAWGFGDACGPIGALAPGGGLLDCGSLAGRIPEGANVYFAPWSGLSSQEVVDGVRAVAALLETV
jgi:sugar phosphate isomerase/epimerase